MQRNANERYQHSQEVIEAQIKYCDDHDLPMFMPRDGICPYCSRDMAQEYRVEEAASW